MLSLLDAQYGDSGCRELLRPCRYILKAHGSTGHRRILKVIRTGVPVGRIAYFCRASQSPTIWGYDPSPGAISVPGQVTQVLPIRVSCFLLHLCLLRCALNQVLPDEWTIHFLIFSERSDERTYQVHQTTCEYYR